MCAKLVEIGMRQCHHVNVCSCYIPIPIVHVCVSITCIIAIDCGTLAHPTNGRVDTSSGTTFMSAVVYSCSTGYNLYGTRSRVCQANGLWSSSPPTCKSN